MENVQSFEQFIGESSINEGAESLVDLLADAKPEVKKLAAEIENMLEPQRFKIGIGYYDKVMKNIAEIAKLSK
jgi:hypothetical protein